MLVAIAGCSDSDGRVPPDATPPGPEPIPPAGVVAWFNLEGSVNDNSGNHFLMQVGGPYSTFFGDGYHGRGCYMDGISQYGVVDASAPQLEFQGAFTVAMWVRPERTPTDFEVIASRSYGSGTDSSFALVIDSTLRVRYDSQGNASLVGATPLVLGEWVHIALTYDGTTKRVFRNGLLDASGPASVPVTWDHRYILIGADEGLSASMALKHLQGSLDDVMLFDRALDASELAAFVAQ
jgi:hypothetical protein